MGSNVYQEHVDIFIVLIITCIKFVAYEILLEEISSIPYQTKTWCPHPVHRNLTRLGSKPIHPTGVQIINAVQADIFNKKSVINSEWNSLILKTGDKVCQTCYSSLPDVANDSFDLKKMDIEFANQMTADSMSDDSENSDSTSIEEKYHTKQLAKEELNAVFEVLKMEKIRDE